MMAGCSSTPRSPSTPTRVGTWAEPALPASRTGSPVKPSGTPHDFDRAKVIHCWAALFIITEAVRDDSPFRPGPLNRLADVELLTAECVHWYNADRLMHRLGRIPPAEYETVYYATNTAQSEAAHQ